MIAEKLIHEESVRIDTDRVARLYIDLGAASAEAVLCQSMEDLALGLARIERCRSAGMARDLMKEAGKLAIVAERIGLPILARVAEDVRGCAGRGDEPALAATLGRLARLGDQSLSAIWDPKDLSV